jgi:hypothetical protein
VKTAAEAAWEKASDGASTIRHSPACHSLSQGFGAGFAPDIREETVEALRVARAVVAVGIERDLEPGVAGDVDGVRKSESEGQQLVFGAVDPNRVDVERMGVDPEVRVAVRARDLARCVGRTRADEHGESGAERNDGTPHPDCSVSIRTKNCAGPHE